MPDVLTTAIITERRRQNLTQADLAQRAGVTRQLISRIERGHPHAEIGPILKLVEALGLQITVTPAPTYTDVDAYLDAVVGDA